MKSLPPVCICASVYKDQAFLNMKFLPLVCFCAFVCQDPYVIDILSCIQSQSDLGAMIGYSKSMQFVIVYLFIFARIQLTSHEIYN